MSDPNDDYTQEHVKTALAEFVQRPAVFLVPGEKDEAVTGVGSGVALLTPRGHVTVLTAWHVAEPATKAPHRLGYRECFRGVDDAVRGVIRGPERPRHPDTERDCESQVDVALVVLSVEAQDAVRDLAVTTAQIADDDVVNDGRDVVVLSGYPFYLSVVPSREPKSRLFSHICYTTSVDGRDGCGRLAVYWGEAVMRSGPCLPQVRARPGDLFDLERPHGTSGGAIWRFRGAKKSELWAPHADGRIIGIPVSWDGGKTEYAESCCLWRDWLNAAVQQVDEHAAT